MSTANPVWEKENLVNIAIQKNEFIEALRLRIAALTAEIAELQSNLQAHETVLAREERLSEPAIPVDEKTKATKRHLSDEAKKKISRATKKRWSEWRSAHVQTVEETTPARPKKTPKTNGHAAAL